MKLNLLFSLALACGLIGAGANANQPTDHRGTDNCTGHRTDGHAVESRQMQGPKQRRLRRIRPV